MVPINQVILGGDPLLGSSMVGNSLDEQLQLIEKYKQNLEAAKQLRQQVQPVQQPAQHRMIWDDIDAEINPMSDEQKSRLLQDEDYVDTYTRIQDMVQAEILSLVKGRIEATPEGKELLQRQLKIVRSLKSKIIQDTKVSYLCLQSNLFTILYGCKILYNFALFNYIIMGDYGRRIDFRQYSRSRGNRESVCR